MNYIGSTPIFSSIGQKVWPIEIPQFLTRKLKHHPSSELGALEVEFRPLSIGTQARIGKNNLELQMND
jgi:hypothetical protein